MHHGIMDQALVSAIRPPPCVVADSRPERSSAGYKCLVQLSLQTLAAPSVVSADASGVVAFLRHAFWSLAARHIPETSS